MNVLDDWTARVAAALDLPAEALDRDLVLDVTKDVAHGVARPAAPLTAYLVGVAVGRGTSLADAAAKVRTLIDDVDYGNSG